MQVHQWGVDHRLGRRILIRPFTEHLKIQLAINLQAQGALAVPALGIDQHREGFFAELPLHEGRGDRIHRSGRVDLLAGGEGQAVWRMCGGHRIGPFDLAREIAKQEGHVSFQVVQDADHLLQG
jgi:hypothetical protein